MRKVFCVLLLVCAGAGMIFAQEKAAAETAEPAAPGVKKNAVTLDTIPLFKGFLATDSDEDISFFCIAAAYERLVAPHFSFGVEVDVYPGKLGDVDYMYFSGAAAGRFYPMSEKLEKVFVGASLGFNSQSIGGKSKAEDGGFTGPLVSLKAGYRILFNDAFFAEPSMSYTYAKTNGELWGMTPQGLGWQGGLRIGVSF